MRTIFLLLLIFPVIIINSCTDNNSTNLKLKPVESLPVDKVKDIAGFFDPVFKVLFTTPSEKEKILKKLNAEVMNDSEYVMPWKSISGNSMQISFQVLTGVQSMIFLYANQSEKNFADFFADSDTARAEFIQGFIDRNGTYARIYRNAKCETVTKDTTLPCTEKVIFTITLNPTFGLKSDYWYSDTLEHKFGAQHNIIRTGKYSTIHQREMKNCLKGGNDYCVEELVVSETESIHSDKDCRQLLEVIPTYRYSCR
ncbi:MAG: hypothetical protein JSS91_06175 [Bacteroidetes bacterium]|nr:hypothetical protein [Bacteroidota bacterium]